MLVFLGSASCSVINWVFCCFGFLPSAFEKMEFHLPRTFNTDLLRVRWIFVSEVDMHIVVQKWYHYRVAKFLLTAAGYSIL